MNTIVRSERLLDRFLRYVRIGTAANPTSSDYPSSRGQIELGELLAHELDALGIEVEQDRHGLVWATIPATVQAQVPTILFNAHLDTSPEAPGDHVAPQVIDAYQGGDIALAHGQMIRAAECPALNQLHGHCLVTSDGSTLLGGDDKAGVAAIMELATHLIENPGLPHGPVRILFTCDEEIGRGALHFTPEKADADAGYTLDGSGHGEIENENFSADQLTVSAIGHNIHPAIAQGRMVNAVRAMAALIDELPVDERSPESTSDREGFLHPYAIEGGVERAECRILLRDFETERLDDHADLVQAAAARIEERFTGLRVEVDRQRQYRNMADALSKSPHVVDMATAAFQALGRTSRLGAIRGGTDGAVFSEKGLPTPNLSVGQHNIHSVLEFASLTEMAWAVEHAVKLLELWQTHARS